MDEPRAVDEVVDRIAAKFPQVPPERVREQVGIAPHGLDDAPVRDFVPVLIEHRVVDALRDEHGA